MLKIFYLVSISLFSSLGWSIPKAIITSLPLPYNLSEEDSFLLKEAIKLEVYQDDNDASIYYYKPPFHIRQYEEGAAGFFNNIVYVNNYVTVLKELRDRQVYAQEYSEKELIRLENKVVLYEEKVQQASDKLIEALMNNAVEYIIDLRRDWLSRMKKELEQLSDKLTKAEAIMNEGGHIMPAGLGRYYFEAALTALAASGLHLNINAGDNPDTVINAINQALDEFGMSYGGSLSFNIYAGFSKSELEALRLYRTKYAPYIKVVLLPHDGLTFFTTREKHMDEDGKVKIKSMFNHASGSGDYLGANINLDTTVVGAMGLAEHLPPFFVSLGVKMKYTQRNEPTKAKLHCDFSNGFAVNGRGDIKDGLVIYDNDIINNFTFKDSNNGNCHIEHISGSTTSAEYEALRQLEKVYNDLNVERIRLSESEKMKYYNYVLADLANNRASGTGVLNPDDGWFTLLKKAAVGVNNFHWHTSIHNIKNISKINFTKELYISGHETLERDLPVDFCLVYNSDIKTYDKCTPKEESKALTMNDAMDIIKQSEECLKTIDPMACGQNRDQAGLNKPKEKRVYTEDNIIIDNI